MDRRQQKTRAAIVQAFTLLVQKKPFERITVQEIIDQANVGRSTFYAHFETKDELLRSMCTDIFHHVFHHALPQEQEAGCDTGLQNLQVKLGNVLYHLGEHKSVLKGILSSQSSPLFLGYLREYLHQLFQGYADEFDPRIPRDFLLHHQGVVAASGEVGVPLLWCEIVHLKQVIVHIPRPVLHGAVLHVPENGQPGFLWIELIFSHMAL